MGSLRPSKYDLDSQILEDTPTSLDVMWASSQTGCGPLKRLLMEVEPIRQPTQATSDSKQCFDLGRARKPTSAPPIFVSSRPSTSTSHCSNESQLRPMKRIRSGSHVFAKPSTISGDDKSRQSQSFDLLGGGKFATEILARVSRSLNQKAISEYSNSQKQPITGQQSSIISKRRTQPLQAQSNIIHNRDYNVPTKSTVIKQTSSRDLNTESTLNGPNKTALAKPLTNLKDSPKKGRLKALLKTIDHDNMGSGSDTDHKTILPVRSTASSKESSEGLLKGKSIGIGQTSCSINYNNASGKQQTASSSNLANIASRRTSREAGYDVQHTAAKSMAKPRKNTISPPPRLQSKRTYRILSQDDKVHSISLCLSDDEEKIHPAFHDSTVETTVNSVDSVGEDDSLYNDANSSSSYGDIDIDLSLLEDVCKKYDT